MVRFTRLQYVCVRIITAWGRIAWQPDCSCVWCVWLSKTLVISQSTEHGPRMWESASVSIDYADSAKEIFAESICSRIRCGWTALDLVESTSVLSDRVLNMEPHCIRAQRCTNSRRARRAALQMCMSSRQATQAPPPRLSKWTSHRRSGFARVPSASSISLLSLRSCSSSSQPSVRLQGYMLCGLRVRAGARTMCHLELGVPRLRVVAAATMAVAAALVRLHGCAHVCLATWLRSGHDPRCEAVMRCICT